MLESWCENEEFLQTNPDWYHRWSCTCSIVGNYSAVDRKSGIHFTIQHGLYSVFEKVE